MDLSKIIRFARSKVGEDLGGGTVLIVEDNEGMADMYASWLDEEYDVRFAYDGETALETVDEDVDAVLLDRRMPGLSGDEVLARIRERGLDCQVSMVTAIDADFEIVEMDFDHYVRKPIGREELMETVEYLIARSTLDDRLQEYQSLRRKIFILQHEHKEPDNREEFARMKNRMKELESEIRDRIEDLERA